MMVNDLGVTYDRNWNVIIGLSNKGILNDLVSSNSVGWFSSVQSLSCVQLFVTPWIAACQASLSTTNSRSLPKLMSIASVMPSSHLILCLLLLLRPQSLPASGSFPMGQLFAWGGPSVGVSASASVLPMQVHNNLWKKMNSPLHYYH